VRGVDPASIFGPLTKAEQPNTFLPLFAQPSLGDVDQDGTPDIVASGGSLGLAIALQGSPTTGGADHLLAIWSGKTGQMLPAAPFVLEDYTFFNSQAIADLNGDDYPEVLTGSGGYFLHAIDGCGREPEGWPKFTGQWIIPTPAIGDLDGDHKLEVAVGTRDGWLYVWHTEATDESTIEWESFHHDNMNTGNLETPLTQGGKRKAAKPLTAEMCAAPADAAKDELAPGGGCGCRVAGDDDARRGLLGGLGLAVAAAAMVARRRRSPRA
jgi:MYXO-CTERM domain-containing protein